MKLVDKIGQIPIIDDHTHIFGCNDAEYDKAGNLCSWITNESLVTWLSDMNMRETGILALGDDQKKINNMLLELYNGRRTVFPARAALKLYRERFGFEADELTVENAGPLVDKIRAEMPSGTEAVYDYISRLGNTELWFCNHVNSNITDERTTRGRFRWVPYLWPNINTLDEQAAQLGLNPPRTADQILEFYVEFLKKAKENGAVAVKGGAYAYCLDRPFAPDVSSVEHIQDVIERISLKKGDAKDSLAALDTLTVLSSKAAGYVGLPVQIHVGLIWMAHGPTRIPEIMDLTPLFHYCPDTTFVVFHGGYPRIDDLAHVTATMTNVRAEFNWVPFWSGLDFSNIIGRWIDMIPNDRILYGSDCSGLNTAVHNMVTVEGLAEAFEVRIGKGYLSERIALQIAANILRNNAIDVYHLDLPKYSF